MSGIENKVVVITGASSGIGEATARHLARRGARLILAARGADRLSSLEREIQAEGGEATALSADVTRPEDVQHLVNEAVERHGTLDVMINNAGIMPVSLLDDLRVDDWNAMVDVHIRGLLNGIAAALPVFRKQGEGHFINTASTAGLKVVPTMAVYAAMKAAVRAISEGLRLGAGPDLRVTVVSPGFTATDFAAGITNDQVREQLSTTRDQLAMPPAAVASAMAYAIEQDRGVDVNELVIRPTAQA